MRDQERGDSLFGDHRDPLLLEETNEDGVGAEVRSNASLEPQRVSDLEAEGHTVRVGVSGKRGAASASGRAAGALLEETVPAEDRQPGRETIGRSQPEGEGMDVDLAVVRTRVYVSWSQLERESAGDGRNQQSAAHAVILRDPAEAAARGDRALVLDAR